jgi:hypothetical protein
VSPKRRIKIRVATTTPWPSGHTCEERFSQKVIRCKESCSAGKALCETWLGGSAHRVKPATDVYLGMSLTAVMPGSGRVRGFSIPTVHGEIGISTSNYEPVDRIGGHESIDFASEFLQRCNALSSIYKWLVTLILRSRLVADLVSESSIRRIVPSSRRHEGGRHVPSSKPRE